jgi:hypothetical protein
MVPLIDLWLPILLSAVLVFVASSVIHMLLPWHNRDFRKLAAEEAVMDALRPFKLEPGEYVAPRPDNMAQMGSPEFKAKIARGPRFTLTVLRDSSIATSLLLWFVYGIVIAAFAAYVSGLTLPAGAPYMIVFRVTGAVAFAAYVLALWHDWIWYSSGLGATVRSTIDGLVYALLTGGTFGWLWP